MGVNSHRGLGCCCCCNPFSCLLNCLYTCICQIICTILIIIAVIIFILWLIFKPRSLQFTVSNASLNQFTLQGNTIRYGMDLNFTIVNPNDRIGIRYEGIDVAALYQGTRFAATGLDPFDQERNTTESKTARFAGQNVVAFEDAEVSTYNAEKSSGEFGIDVRLNVRIRLKFLFVESAVMKPKIDCPIQVPLTANGAAPPPFVPQECGFVW